MRACFYGSTSCAREVVKDSRVKVNEPDNNGFTPLWQAAYYGSLNVIKWWIASEREIDLGKPGDIYKTDAIGGAKERGNAEVVTLLERFESDAAKTRHAMRVELGLLDELAAEVFALVIFVSDGLLQVKNLVDSTSCRKIPQGRLPAASGASNGYVLSCDGVSQGNYLWKGL